MLNNLENKGQELRELLWPALIGLWTEEELRRWFAPLQWDYRPEEGRLTLTAPTIFHRRAITAHLATLSSLAAERQCPLKEITVHCQPANEQTAPTVLKLTVPPNTNTLAALPPNLSGIYRFENFKTAESNKLPLMAAHEALNGALIGKALLLISSGPWGKTHLLESMAWKLAQEGKTPFVKLGRADTDFGSCPSHGFILIDDVPLLADKPSLQQQLCQAFDKAVFQPLTLVLTSSQPPLKLLGLEESLRSRLSGALILPIEPLELKVLLTIGRQEAERLNLDLPEDFLAQLGRRIDNDPRQWRGLLETVAWLVRKAKLTLPQALERLGYGTGNEVPTTELPMETILAGVADVFGLKVSDLIGHNRSRQIAWARRIAISIARDLTSLTTLEIGQALGGRDHSTVVHALQKIQTELKNRTQLEMVENIKSSLVRTVATKDAIQKKD